ncbi:DUF6491 family protein [Sphingorhabdus profundilacus]|uniref:DUF6491 family protein n=1 Tax=Sphingorhabdus profundilacus TaxID=2509718 RepID=UPI001FEAA1EB|nr:DUF6491 family protein [Sphingorhabdus profundilacus]
MKSFFIIALAAATLAAPVEAKRPEPYVWPELGVESKIIFPHHDAIRNFEADGSDGVWLEDRQRRWYYAELMGGCHDLDFAQAIGFDTGGSPHFDKFSSIIVRGQKCPLISLQTSEKPLPRKERLKLRNAAKVAAKDVVAPSN